MKPASVAILSTGEMGHMMARALGARGIRVLTCLQGRSARTRELAARSGAQDLPTLGALAAAADMMISVVVPSAARSLASAVAAAMAESGRGLLYADANAISPMTSAAIEAEISSAGGRYVDACIIGSALKWGKGTTLYVSGPHAAEFLSLNDCGLNVALLGDRVGQASAFKIIYAGFTKGLSALSAELLLAAYSLGILDQITERYRTSYPELVGFMEANLPWLPFRAGRRSEEMEELTATMRAAGLDPVMAPASGRALKSIGDLQLRSCYSDDEEIGWDIEDVMEILHGRLVHEKG